MSPSSSHAPQCPQSRWSAFDSWIIYTPIEYKNIVLRTPKHKCLSKNYHMNGMQIGWQSFHIVNPYSYLFFFFFSCLSVSSSLFLLHLLLFFQAEDGIRDCLLSRGLGDVYKRQVHIKAATNPGGNIGGTMLILTTLSYIAIIDSIYLVHFYTKLLLYLFMWFDISDTSS